MFLDNVIFHFYKGGGHPPDRTPEPQWFFVNNLGGGEKSLLTNVNKKMVFFIEGFPNPNAMSPVVMGVTSTVVYMLPFLSLPLTAAARCYILTLIQVLISLVETAEAGWVTHII